MKILLVSATSAEISLIKESAKHDITTIITGVGMVATAYALGETFAKGKYDLAVQAGIAGSFREKYPPGTVVNVVEDCFSELGAEDDEELIALHDLGLATNASSSEINSFDKLPKTKGITVNTVHGSKKSIELVKKRFDPDVESMEGAAFLYSCRMAGVACVQIRAVSNYVKPRARNSWKVELAVSRLCEFLNGVLK